MSDISATSSASALPSSSPAAAAPAPESRVKKTLLNARVNLIFYFLTLCLSFFSRKIFLDTLGADFVGLTGTLQNLLGFLNLAELGIATAIGYTLYKPLYDRNHHQISEILSVMGYLYRWIGLVIAGAGIVLSFFLPLIYPTKGTGFSIFIIYFGYFSFLISALIGYFINYRQNLLGADQKNYVITAYFQGINILKLIIQLWLAWKTQSYFLWFAIELIFGIIYSYILNWKINRIYPWLKSSYSLGKHSLKKYPEIITKTKQLFFHQISGFVQFQTIPMLTYAFTSLQLVAYLGNYTLILDKISQFINTVFNSVAAGIGNLIAEDNPHKTLVIFWQLCAIRIFIAGSILFICAITFEPFIKVWLGGEYILPMSVFIILLVKFYFQFIAGSVSQFVYGFGLFGDVWSSFAQSGIFIVGALLGGYYFGLNGILFAGFISIFLIACLWKPYYLFKKGFKLPVSGYWIRWTYLNLLNGAAFLLAYWLVDLVGCSNASTMGQWTLNTLLATAFYAICSTSIFLLFSTEIRALTTRFVLKKAL